MADLPKLVRTRAELIDTHLTDDDIVLVLDRLKSLALSGDWQAAKLLLEFKYGRNPEPVNNDLSLEDLMAETPLGVTPGPDAI